MNLATWLCQRLNPDDHWGVVGHYHTLSDTVGMLIVHICISCYRHNCTMVHLMQSPWVNALSASQQQQLFDVFDSNEALRVRYDCDVIFVTDLQEDHNLWKEIYGLDRNDRPKGIPKIKIGEAL